MDTPRGRSPAPLIAALAVAPHRFDFFQAVRVLRWAGRGRRVRFRAATGQAFPPSAIAGLRLAEDDTDVSEMTVGFLGLIGPSGVLPPHYDDAVTRRLRDGDAAPRDFLDLFHNRLVSLFHAAWEKHHPLVSRETARREGRGEDPFTAALLALVGLGTPGLAGRLPFPDAALLPGANHLARAARSATALADLLALRLGALVEVEQFRPGWLTMEPSERTRLSGTGGFARLGADAVLGERVRDRRHRFRIRIGPISLRAFLRLLPPGEDHAELRAFVRQFAPADLSWDLLLLLRGEEAPPCRLGGATPPRLGWTTWLRGAPQPDPAAAEIEPEGTDDGVGSPLGAQ
jgi:type VI secretion system protein ImpH